jgi:hypothetical protein
MAYIKDERINKTCGQKLNVSIIAFVLWVMLKVPPEHLLSMLKNKIKDKFNVKKITFYIFEVFFY